MEPQDTQPPETQSTPAPIETETTPETTPTEPEAPAVAPPESASTISPEVMAQLKELVQNDHMRQLAILILEGKSCEYAKELWFGKVQYLEMINTLKKAGLLEGEVTCNCQ